MSGVSEIADCPPSPIADDPSVRPLPTFSPSPWTSLVAQTLKHLPTMQETWVGKISWRRKWQPTPVLLPGKSHGLRNLVGYSPWGRKESDPTEELPFLPFLPPPVSNSPCLFTRCQPPYACSCTVPLCFSLYCKIKNVFFILCVCFLCFLMWKTL